MAKTAKPPKGRATLPFKTGVDLINEYKSRFGDKTLLGFSRGKDSIATALAIGDRLDVYPVFFFVIPGLPIIEESLDYYSKKLFHGRRIIQFPEAAFYKWLNSGLYQTPGSSKVIEAADIRPFSSGTGHKWWREVTSWVLEDEGLPEQTLAAVGIRGRDSPFRWLNVKNNGPIRPNAKNWLPIWDWSKHDVAVAIDKAGISLPPDYLLFGRSFGGGVDARYLVPMKRHRPEDWKIICEWFPLAEVCVWRYERFIEGKAVAA